MFKAVLFDMDGVMLDTELVQSLAFEMVLAEYGITNPKKNEHGTVHVSGATTPETWEILKKEYGLEADTEELTAKKRAAVMKALDRDLEALPGLHTLLADLKRHDIRIAVASSAQRERLVFVLDRLGITEHFDATVSGNDVKHGKPAPDPYLLAAKQLSVEPSECVVIEDAYVGIQSAKAAGTKAVAVPHEFTKRMDFSSADLVVDSLNELSYDKLASLFD